MVLEAAADELGRLDTVVALAPASLALALRSAAVAALSKGTRAECDALVAAESDTLLDRALPQELLGWRDQLDDGERRARSGSAIQLDATGASSEFAALLQRTPDDRSPLERAIAVAAEAPSDAMGELAAALLLCRDGRMGRVRLLPFAGVDPALRRSAVEAYRAGAPMVWTRLATEALTQRARRLRRAALPLHNQHARDEALLAPLGRAAITARRAASLLLADLAGTMPWVAESLGLSRPAAADALERLCTLGIARELTGRARDRVYGYGVSLAAAGTLLGD
ncbi:MAG: hypothetical protein IT357_08540 [Gemmatimonadaceae bacterium]|nr:hypothetical protein [Gemmatimonadaceae bacterium]